MTEKDLVISQVHTICKNCVFSEVETKNGKITQKGCKLDKLKQYKDAGIEILDVFDEDENEFHVINGRFCVFRRSYEFMESYPKDSWEDIVRVQTKLPYQMMIFIKKDTTLKDIRSTIRCIKNQESQPNFVTFINFQYIDYNKEPDKHVKPLEILELIQNSELHRFSLKNIYDENVDYRTAIDLAMDSTNKYSYPFYTCFEAGFKIPDSFSTELSESIFIKMKQIGFAEPVDDINGMIVSKVAHKKHGGNSFFVNLENKLKEFEDDSYKFLHKAEDICPSLKPKE